MPDARMPSTEIRIALCTDGVFPHAMGGMQRHSRLLAEHLSTIPGIRLIVIHPHPPGIFHSGLRIEEVPIAPIDEQRFYLKELWRYSGRVAAELDRLQPDVVLSQGFCVWQDIERYTSRLITMPHGLEMFQGLTLKDRLLGLPFRMLVRHVTRRSARAVSLGGKLTPMLASMTEGSGAKVVVLPNAVHLPAEVAAYPVDGDALRLLFVGRFAFNKGIDLLLRVAARFDAEQAAVRFILAGDGPERARIEHGSPGNVTLAGKVDDARLEELYADCHALVLPTRFEGMPTVVLEAMARARPVIVSDVGASAELVDAANGFLIPPGDEEALHGAISSLLALSAEQRAWMGMRGRERAGSRFTWPEVAAAFARLAKEVAQRV